MRSPALSVVLALVSAAPLLAAQSPAGKPTKQDTPARDPSFQASEGATGIENPLAYDEVLALGTVQVGQGPNAGTLVRVRNSGGAAMTLAAPRLLGTHPGDFAVEVQSSTLSAEAAARLPRLRAPFQRLASASGPGQVLVIDAAALAGLRALREVALNDFPLPGLGPVTLVLQRRELPIRADSKLVIDGREVAGGLRRLVGELQIWSGSVSGLAGSRVFLVLDGGVVRGYFQLPSEPERWIFAISDGPGRVRLVREPELEALGVRRPGPDVCAGQLVAPGGAALARTPPRPQGLPTAALTATDCRLAIETDWQLYQLFNSSALLTSYVTGLVAAASDQYFADVQSTLSIAYLGVHTNSNDGWTSQETPGAGTYELLEEHRAAWGTTWPAEAELAHFLSGAPLGGGIAYLDVLCNTEYGFGVSANLGADIDWPNWTGAPGDFWDYLVFAHELGHNFGSYHTHDYCPPLDDCYDNCTGNTNCPRGTIMGYCHLCPGGVSNVDLRFHPVTSEIIRERVNASCMDATVLQPGDFVQYRVRFNPWTTTGAKSAALVFEHDAPNAQQPFRVQLTGTAN